MRTDRAGGRDGAEPLDVARAEVAHGRAGRHRNATTGLAHRLRHPASSTIRRSTGGLKSPTQAPAAAVRDAAPGAAGSSESRASSTPM